MVIWYPTRPPGLARCLAHVRPFFKKIWIITGYSWLRVDPSSFLEEGRGRAETRRTARRPSRWLVRVTVLLTNNRPHKGAGTEHQAEVLRL